MFLFFVELAELSNCPPNSSDPIPADYSIWAAAGVSSEVKGHQTSETSPKRLLGPHQPRTNQRCY